VDGGGIADAAQILGPRLLRDGSAVDQWPELIAEERLGRRSDQALGEVVILDEEEPLPVRPGELGVRLLVQRQCGQDVDDDMASVSGQPCNRSKPWPVPAATRLIVVDCEAAMR
jgi:hypothetical protein